MKREQFEAQIGVSRETSDKLQRYADLLDKWSRAINLVAKSTLQDVWGRHFLDSAQLWAFAPEHAHRWLDLGSGAGFPGLVVALLAAEKRPDMMIRLVESDRRKCTFLAEVSRETLLSNVEITCARVEDIKDQADVVSARAFAPLSKLLEYTEPLIAPNGVALFPKGENASDELTAASRDWHIQSCGRKSLTDPAGMILEITSFRRE